MKHIYISYLISSSFLFRASPVAASGHLYFLSLLFLPFFISPFRSSYRNCSMKKIVMKDLNIQRKKSILEPLLDKV